MDFINQYKGLRKECYVLVFGRLVTGLGSMVWPMLTLILSQKLGVSAKHISWILAASGLLMIPAILVGGRIADRFDKRKNIIYLDAVSVVCFLACAFVRLSWWSIVLMFVGALCQNMENPSYNALTADMSSTEDRERAYSLQYLGANLGLALAPTLAGLLFNRYLWLIFLFNGLSIGSSAILIALLIKDTRPVVERTAAASYQEIRSEANLIRILKENPVILIFIAAISGYYATYQMYVYLMPLDLAAIHGDSGALIFGSVTSINCIVVVLFTPIVTRLFRGKSEPVKCFWGMVLLLAGFGLFVLCEGMIPVYYISMTVLTWGEIFTMLSESPYVTRRIPASHRGRINGFMTVVRTGVTSAYQVLIGFIYAAAGSRTTWIVVLSIGLGFVALYALLDNRDRKAYVHLYD